MGHKVIDNTQNTAVQDQLEALKQLKDRLASHTKFGFKLKTITMFDKLEFSSDLQD